MNKLDTEWLKDIAILAFCKNILSIILAINMFIIKLGVRA